MPCRVVTRFFIPLIAATLTIAACGTAVAGDVALDTPFAGDYNLRVTSYSEIPYQTVVHQQFDYSCGSAALATLLRFGYSLNSSEADVFKAMYRVGDQEKIQKLGFSLLDMKSYLASLGYQADGYRLSLAELNRLNIPAIALIQVGSYKHFVVIKGTAANHLLIGDPAKGLQLYSESDFKNAWNGIAFIIHDANRPLQPTFNSPTEWKHWTDAHPLAAVSLGQNVADFVRDLRVIYQIRPNQILPSPLAQ